MVKFYNKFKMTRGALINLLIREAKDYREDNNRYTKSQHMHDLREPVDSKVEDAVLVGFINYVGLGQGLDVALYTKDFTRTEIPQINE